MTYNVSSGTLSLYTTTSRSQALMSRAQPWLHCSLGNYDHQNKSGKYNTALLGDMQSTKTPVNVSVSCKSEQ